ncbi:hypothetical protein [Nocardia inohanensis]|uniref:hypothetical protein n=1 Tax=Nocardia inohanensis TaxID=209246 RepID=UPI0008328789|nr:hypothetical protein [Nocardia inohanensis]
MSVTATGTAPTPKNPAAPALSVAFRAIVIALAAGTSEAVFQAARYLDHPAADIADLLPGLMIRATVYLAVLALAYRMADGSRWARNTLMIGLGTLGLASLLIEPIGAVLDAPGELFARWTVASWLIAVCRTVHIVAVLVAVPAMLRAGRFVRRGV